MSPQHFDLLFIKEKINKLRTIKHLSLNFKNLKNYILLWLSACDRLSLHHIMSQCHFVMRLVFLLTFSISMMEATSPALGLLKLHHKFEFQSPPKVAIPHFYLPVHQCNGCFLAVLWLLQPS